METMSHRDFQLLLWENAFQNAIPASDIFELTPYCNLDCRMCYVHLLDPSLREKMISGEEWIAIMDQAMELGMITATLTGGEAMTHPDFWKIYRHLSDHGISISVKTNGILLNETARAVFRELPPSTVDISIYGCDRESYQTITGHDLFETADRNIHAAVEEGLPVRFMITPTGYMGERAEEFMRYAKDFHVKTVVNTQLLDPHEDTGRKKDDFDLSPDQVVSVLKKAYELFPPENLSLEEEEPVSDQAREEVSEKPDDLRCIAGRSHFAITWDGMMIPCVNFPRELISRNVKELGVKQAWKEVHEAIVNFRRPKTCGHCRYRNKCNYCPSSHGKYAVRHACSPNACALEKKLIDKFRGGIQ